MTQTPRELPLPGREQALLLLREMLRIRRFEEKAAEVYSAQKIRGFLHLYIGEEAVAVGLISQLRAEDAIISTYREHGHALARGVEMGAIMAEMYGKQEGCSRGRGGSMHLFDAKTRFYGGNAIVGGGIPLAVGLALASDMRDETTGERLKVPHMGWNQVDTASPMLDPGGWYYFVHSYHVVPEDPALVAATSEYGSRFCAAVARDNVFACQFHPEKSHHAGARLIERFLSQ